LPIYCLGYLEIQKLYKFKRFRIIFIWTKICSFLVTKPYAHINVLGGKWKKLCNPLVKMDVFGTIKFVHSNYIILDYYNKKM
jgi:hypothetical protein